MALCLLGFRGSGYSPGFTAKMGATQAALQADPGRAVRLLDAPDDICTACPNLGPQPDGADGCRLGGPAHEEHMRAHDATVLARLGLVAGAVTTWAALLGVIRTRIRGADLPGICTTCPWLPLGVCQSSVDGLRPGGPDHATGADPR
jgi:hypothetical protein